MLIRPAIPTDVKVIYQFICELEETSFDFFHFEKLFLKNINHSDYYYLVAEIQQEVIGYLSCHAQDLLHHCGKVGEIQELFISTNHRNKRIGQALIEEINRIASIHNWINIEVTCNQKRKATHRFYEREKFIASHLKFTKKIKKA